MCNCKAELILKIVDMFNKDKMVYKLQSDFEVLLVITDLKKKSIEELEEIILKGI
jgi:hypothetical protein